MNKKYILSVLIGLIISFGIFTLSIYEGLSVIFFLSYATYFIQLIGRKIIILEIACFTAILGWLIAPIPFYYFFNDANELAVLWVKVMPLSSDDYYSFVLPATITMVLGFSLRFRNSHILLDSKTVFPAIKKYLENKSVLGYVLIFTGFASGFLFPYVPDSLAFIFYLLQSLTLTGLLYLYFSKVPNRKFFLVLGFALLLVQSIRSAMFGEMIYMTMLVGFMLISIRKIPFMYKALILISGIYFVFVLQTIKHEYRSIAWKQGANPLYFGELLVSKLTNPFQSMDEEATLGVLARLNQGWLICKTMYHVPKDKPYAYGETIALSVAASVVPRIFWPTKPKAGGHYNLERFWGYKLERYSMNIGPVGEAYGNFGKYGGIVFMFFYGLIFNYFLNIVLGFVKSRPTWILWLPFLFLYAIGTETDIVSTVNYVVKSLVFLFLLRILLFEIFKIRL